MHYTAPLGSVSGLGRLPMHNETTNDNRFVLMYWREVEAQMRLGNVAHPFTFAFVGASRSIPGGPNLIAVQRAYPRMGLPNAQLYILGAYLYSNGFGTTSTMGRLREALANGAPDYARDAQLAAMWIETAAVAASAILA